MALYLSATFCPCNNFQFSVKSRKSTCCLSDRDECEFCNKLELQQWCRGRWGQDSSEGSRACMHSIGQTKDYLHRFSHFFFILGSIQSVGATLPSYHPHRGERYRVCLFNHHATRWYVPPKTRFTRGCSQQQ